MRILRTSGKVKDLYIVSSKDSLEKMLIFPEVPNNFLTRLKYENYDIPRINLYKSIDDAISATFLGQELEGAKLSVYKALGVRNENLIEVSITNVPYALLLDELWYTGKLSLKKIGDIRILDKKDTEIFRYGPRSTKSNLYRWNWEFIKKPWEIKFKK